MELTHSDGHNSGTNNVLLSSLGRRFSHGEPH